jgi:peptide deformylase
LAIRILVYKGDPLLNKKSRAVERFDARLGELIDDMIETRHKKRAWHCRAPGRRFEAVVIVEPKPGRRWRR